MPALQVPPQYKDVIVVNPEALTYSPHIWFNDFWTLRDHLVRAEEREGGEARRGGEAERATPLALLAATHADLHAP